MENILSEYDKSPGIISPDFEKMDLHLPKKAVFAFLGEKRIERFALARGGEKVGTFVSLTKDFPLWMIKADKEELCILQAPAGASAADIVEGVLRENHVPCESWRRMFSLSYARRFVMRVRRTIIFRRHGL